MWINYKEAIKESESELLELEHGHRGSSLEDRVKMLRLLKSGRYRSQARLAPVLGYSDRQLRKWWHSYKQAGLALLLDQRRPAGKKERVSPQALEALKQEMATGSIALLKQAEAYLRDRYGIEFKAGIKSISALFKRHKIKLKTGRRRHLKSSAEKQEAFKK